MACPYSNEVATHRTQVIEWMQAWSRRHAQPVLATETPDEEVLDIRLGDRRQIFLWSPRQEESIHILIFGMLSGTEHRHGCPGRFTNSAGESVYVLEDTQRRFRNVFNPPGALVHGWQMPDAETMAFLDKHVYGKESTFRKMSGSSWL